MAVAIWDLPPSADALLDARLAEGWRPTPSYLVSGPTVMGHAASVPRDQWTTPDGDGVVACPR